MGYKLNAILSSKKLLCNLYGQLVFQNAFLPIRTFYYYYLFKGL